MPQVYQSRVIEAPVAGVWAVIRDFNALPVWTPLVAESRIEGNAPPDQIGCVRAFRLKDGGFIRERLLALSDYEFSQTYAILDSPMGVTNYVATLRLIPITAGGQTFAEWSADFDCPDDREQALVEQIGRQVFAAGLQALGDRFKASARR